MAKKPKKQVKPENLTDEDVMEGLDEFNNDPSLSFQEDQGNPDFEKRFNEYQESVNNQFQTLNTQLGEVAQVLKGLGQQTQNNDPSLNQQEGGGDEDFNNRFFVDPKGALTDLLTEFGTNLEKKLTTKYTTDQSQKNFWENFYKDNPDLKGLEHLVDNTLISHGSELADLPVEQAAPKLADLAREQGLKIAQQFSKGKSKSVVLEQGGNQTPVDVQSQQTQDDTDNGEDKLTSMTDILKSRRASRRQGKAG